MYTAVRSRASSFFLLSQRVADGKVEWIVETVGQRCHFSRKMRVASPLRLNRLGRNARMMARMAVPIENCRVRVSQFDFPRSSSSCGAKTESIVATVVNWSRQKIRVSSLPLELVTQWDSQRHRKSSKGEQRENEMPVAQITIKRTFWTRERSPHGVRPAALFRTNS